MHDYQNYRNGQSTSIQFNPEDARLPAQGTDRRESCWRGSAMFSLSTTVILSRNAMRNPVMHSTSLVSWVERLREPAGQPNSTLVSDRTQPDLHLDATLGRVSLPSPLNLGIPLFLHRPPPDMDVDEWVCALAPVRILSLTPCSPCPPLAPPGPSPAVPPLSHP